MREKRRLFTIDELKEFDGRAGRPAYIAFKGKVYDVSESVLWTDGKHMGRHIAGGDLTNTMINAPHGEEVLMKSPIVGELSHEKFFRKNLIQRIEGLHLHPIVVHFSIAYSIVVSLLSLLYVFTNELSFEMASYFLLIFGFLATPPCAISGFFSWSVTYEGRMTKTFARKIILTTVVFVVITACFVWRTLDPHIQVAKTNLSYIYLALVLSLTPITIILGYYGGKIVYS